MTQPKIVMITGVTGTLGRSILEKLLRDTDYHVLGISRDEQKQRTLPKHARARYRLADVRDTDSLFRAADCKLDLVLHLAALKCVDTLEFNPSEAYKTNVIGTQNICDLASQYGARVCFTSTDKACYPVNAYGMSKAMAERIVTQQPDNVVVRYGNVLGSRGSFLPVLVDKIKAEEPVQLTHENMTRFWMLIESVRDFVVEVALNDVVTGVVTPKDIKASYVKELIESVARVMDKEPPSLEMIGMRPGEKYHECLNTEFETDNGKPILTSDNNLRFTSKELDDLIRPIVEKLCD